MTDNALVRWFESGCTAFENALEARLPQAGTRLADAIRHGTLGGGKRLRPYLVLQSAALFGPTGQARDSVAAALEAVHCYSLIHDDLPAMDNDDLRRGRPTVHRAYDEATAILAGDALLTMAFDWLSAPDIWPDAAVPLRLVRALAKAAGHDGMVGGQMLDLDAEGRFGDGIARPLTEAQIIALQGKKTGALMVFGATAGALMQPAVDPDALRALERFGQALGLAFQIRDDLIDVEGDAATAGKATGKDHAAGKGTFVTLLGVEGARARLAQASRDGEDALAHFGARSEPLRAVLDFNQTRQS